MAGRLSRRSLARYIADAVLAPSDDVQSSQWLTQVAAYLVHSHRTKEASLIIRDVEQILAERGHLVGTVTTAFDLTSELQASLERAIAAQYQSVSLTHQVDPDVIGGLRLDLPGRQLDATIARQLTILKTRFKKA